MDRSLRAVLLGTFTLRFSTGLTGAMLALYLAQLATRPGHGINAEVVGLLSATFFLAELVLSPFFGVLSDRYGHHRVMLWGPLFGAVAVILTGLTTNVLILGGTRWLEGSSSAASIPSILGYIAMATAGDEGLRGRASARFEAATLAGLGAGFIAAPTLFHVLGPGAFFLNAVLYMGSFTVYRRWVRDPAGEQEALARTHVNVARYVALIRESRVWLLAPAWIAVNASIGLWFSQSLFQLAKRDPRFPDQWLLQGFGYGQITAALVVIAVVFGAGILWWGNRFDRMRRTTIMLLGALGGIGLVVAGLVVNHGGHLAGSEPVAAAAVACAIAIAAVGLFILAGATPAAVGLLADVSEGFPGDRGAVMGLYSVFLGIGQIAGSLLGGLAAQWRGMDGLLLATGALLTIALLPLTQLRAVEHYVGGPATPAHLAEDEARAI